MLITELEGLEADALAKIEQRLKPVDEWLATHLGVNIDENDARNNTKEQPLAKRFLALEEEITQVRSSDATVRANGRSRWRDEFLYPLAPALDLIVMAKRMVALKCVSRHWLDSPDKTGMHQPELEDVLPALFAVLDDYQTVDNRITALLEQGFCVTERDARFVAEAFMDIPLREAAAKLVRGVLLAGIDLGAIGLLVASNYQYTEIVLHLERYAHLIAASAEDPQRVLGQLRRELVGLQQAFETVDRKLRIDQLLHGSAGSSERQRYKTKWLKPSRLTRVCHVLSEQRGISEEQAKTQNISKN